MHVAIDDTYGPNELDGSRYVTGSRRTHVAVFFPDDEVEEIRTQLRSMLEYVNTELNVAAKEFHFTDIYNRRGAWSACAQGENIAVFETFAEIYSQHRWEVRVQTMDDRTLADHGINGFSGKLDGLDLTDRSELSLAFLLLVKVKPALQATQEHSSIIVDEGIGKAGQSFGNQMFHDLEGRIQGRYANGINEPLLQIADFFAYSINRCTHIAYKESRSEIDDFFLQLIGTMAINSPDISTGLLPRDFTSFDTDLVHSEFRNIIGIE